MIFLPEILLLSLIVFLYWIFVLAKDDFILLRKNVTLEQLFNLSFVTFLVGLASARGVYVLEHLSWHYLNLFVLFLFPYFPGLSLSGGIFGGFLYVLYKASRKKIPFGRILDIFSLSFFAAWNGGFFLIFIADLFLTRKFNFLQPSALIFFILIFILCFWLFARSKMQDGSIGFLGLGFFSIVYFGFDVFQRGIPKTFAPQIEAMLFCVIFLTSIILFFKEESTLFKSNKKK